MEYKFKEYKGEQICIIPGEEFGKSYPLFQVYFKDGARSKVIENPERLIDDVEHEGYYLNYQRLYKWDKSDMFKLTKDNANEIVGKRVYFFSEQYQANANAEGITNIESFDANKRNPILGMVESGEDTGLNFAFINKAGEICLGDSDRPVFVKVV